jgi:hypothetical protein
MQQVGRHPAKRVINALMGLTPMIPKRLLLLLTLFNPVAALLLVPFALESPSARG